MEVATISPFVTLEFKLCCIQFNNSEKLLGSSAVEMYRSTEPFLWKDSPMEANPYRLPICCLIEKQCALPVLKIDFLMSPIRSSSNLNAK